MSSFYAAAGAIIENKNGEILMVQEGKDHIHGKWNFPGGGWEDKESIIDCIKREVLEETGYKAKINGFLGTYKELNQKDGTETVVFMFTGETIKRKFENPKDPEEILSIDFFSPEEIEDLKLRHENRREIIRKYQEEEPEDLEILWNRLNLL